MKWRDTTYRAGYVVKRICLELHADAVQVWEIMDEEFDKEPGASMSQEEAQYLSDIVEAGLKAASEAFREPPQDQLLTRQEAAEILKMHVNTLDLERAAGRLGYIQRGVKGRVMIPRKAINDYLNRNVHQPVPERCLRETWRKRRAV